jgi:hypothetical protein
MHDSFCLDLTGREPWPLARQRLRRRIARCTALGQRVLYVALLWFWRAGGQSAAHVTLLQFRLRERVVDFYDTTDGWFHRDDRALGVQVPDNRWPDGPGLDPPASGPSCGGKSSPCGTPSARDGTR